MDLDTHLLLVSLVGILNVVGLDLAILELDALCNLREIMSGNSLIEIDVVDLLLEVLGMRQLRGEVAIVGEEEHTRGVTVETTNGVDALGAGVLDQVHNSLALLRVIAGGDVVLGFVEEHVDLLLDRDGLVVELHLIGAQHLGAQFGDHLSIDGDHTGLDELISLATAADTSVGEVLIETHRLVGIIVDLLVLDTLLQAILGIGVIVGSALTLVVRLLAIGSLAIRTVALTGSSVL